MKEIEKSIEDGTFHTSHKEKLKQALKEVKYCDGVPLVRKCMICDEYLDTPSEVIADIRSNIEHIISHGAHDDCAEKWLNEDLIT